MRAISIGSWTDQDASEARPGAGSVFAFLALLIICNTFLIVVLEDAFQIRDHFTLLGLPDSFYQKPLWGYLVPQPEVFGTWASTTVVAAALVQKVIHPAWVLLVSQNVLVIVSFFVGLSLTRSFVFAATAALLAVTVPFNFHVYSVHGTTAQGLLLSYFLLAAHASVLAIRKPSWGSLAYLAIAGTLLVLGYETWLDVGVVVLGLGLPVGLLLWRAHGREIATRFAIYVCGVFAIMLAYVMIKTRYGFGSGEGTETDLLFHYDNLAVMAIDYGSKVVTFFFTALSLVLPPQIAGSIALQSQGGQWLIDQQHGYHLQMQFLTYLNHVFLWRFFAGAYFVLVAAVGVWAYLRLWSGRQDWWLWIIVVGAVMLLIGASTHSVVKFRPMHSMPYLGYQVWVNVLGAIALVAVLVHQIADRFRLWSPTLTVVIAWTALVWTGFAVRTSLGVYADNMFMGTYPDPAGKLTMLLGSLW